MPDKTVPLPELTAAELERFHSLIEVDTRTGCWNWVGPKWTQGYGYLSIARWGIARAHRISYALHYGDTTEHLDHLCHDPNTCQGGPTCPHRACVNPKHLQPASKRTNVLRGGGPSARNFRKTHCVNGHEFTNDNTVYDAGGWRQCRTCRNERAATRRAERGGNTLATGRPSRAKLRAPRPCAECGSHFVPGKDDAVYCSQRCGQRARRRKR